MKTEWIIVKDEDKRLDEIVREYYGHLNLFTLILALNPQINLFLHIPKNSRLKMIIAESNPNSTTTKGIKRLWE